MSKTPGLDTSLLEIELEKEKKQGTLLEFDDSSTSEEIKYSKNIK